MGDELEPSLGIRHSFCTPKSPKSLETFGNNCKSDINVLNVKLRKSKMDSDNCKTRQTITNNLNRSLGEYYKKYEHDEVPVKDMTLYASTQVDRDGSITNSELDKLEMKIFRNISQDLGTNNSSITSLESNIKFLKTTVQELFDIFYASMRDFEVYKKRFNDILAKKQEDAVADMEDFIKDMIQHIMTSESSISNESKKSSEGKKSDFCENSISVCSGATDEEANIGNQACVSDIEETISPATTNTYLVAGKRPVSTTYKNDDYFTDSTLDEKLSKTRARKEEVYNIYLLSGTPCVQIKMNERNLLSEINIKEPSHTIEGSKYVASAENIKKLAAKKMELEKYVEQEQDNDDSPDREIPVKVSFAKKNIHLDEDFTQNERECEKSFISKICNFICRKFRKSGS